MSTFLSYGKRMVDAALKNQNQRHKGNMNGFRGNSFSKKLLQDKHIMEQDKEITQPKEASTASIDTSHLNHQLHYYSSESDQSEVVVNNDSDLTKDTLKEVILDKQQQIKRTEKKNPKRPCPFCGVFQSKLSRHLRLIHKNETEVSTALTLPALDRNIIFSHLRKQGILKTKIADKLRNKPENNILQERTAVKEETKLCRECGGFYSRKTIHKHRRKCAETEYSCSLKLNFITTVAPISVSFDNQVVSKISTDDIGKYLRKDTYILQFGDYEFKKNVKGERLKSIRHKMRFLARLVIKMRHVSKNDNLSSADILCRANFQALEKSLEELSEDEAGELKPGPKITGCYIIKNFANFLSGLYITQDETDKFKETESFLKLLQFRWTDMNFAAEKKIRLSKSEKLRRPNELPDENDIKKLRDYTFKEIETLVIQKFSRFNLFEFVKLRNLILCRLTLFNARRGGEPARLLLQSYDDAKSDVWIDSQRLDQVRDPIDRELLDTYKITYQAGKGQIRLVPILIPKNLITAIDRLIAERNNLDIPANNKYLFATAKSETHVQGWSAVKYCVDSIAYTLNKPHLLIADKFRHRASTLYAQLDIPIERRQYFYSHMGHSEDINKHVYQAPLATQQIIHVGGFLHNLDKDKLQVSHGHQESDLLSKSKVATNKELSKTSLVAGETNDEFESLHLMGDTAKTDSNCNGEVSVISAECLQQSTWHGTQKPKKARFYVSWREEESLIVMNYFQSYISNNLPGAKGSLPGKKEIVDFLSTHEILTAIPEEQKIQTIKSKVFNERQKIRKQLM